MNKVINFLYLEQALADYARFIEEFKSTVNKHLRHQSCSHSNTSSKLSGNISSNSNRSPVSCKHHHHQPWTTFFKTPPSFTWYTLNTITCCVFFFFWNSHSLKILFLFQQKGRIAPSWRRGAERGSTLSSWSGGSWQELMDTIWEFWKVSFLFCVFSLFFNFLLFFFFFFVLFVLCICNRWELRAG